MNSNARLPWVIAASAMLFALLVLVRSEISDRSPAREGYAPQTSPYVQSPVSYPAPPDQWRPLDTPVPRLTPAPTPAPAGVTLGPTPVANQATPEPTPAPPPAHVLKGRVTGSGGKPLERARIRLIVGEEKPAEMSAVTDSTGIFEIENVKANIVDKLIAEAPGHSATILENLPLPLPDLLELGLSPLSGVDAIVIDASNSGAGEPTPFSGEMETSLLLYTVAGATTDTFGISQPNLPIDSFVPARNQQTVVQDGILIFNNVEPGQYKVVARSGNKVAESPAFTVGQGERTSTTLVLGSQQVVRGKIWNEQGRPVPQASVSLAPARDLSSAPQFPDYLSFTDGNGDFVIPEVLPGEYWLLVGATGYTTKTLEGFLVDPATEPAETSVTLLTQQPLIVVSVSNAEGRPLAKAPLVVMTVGGPTRKTFFGSTDDAGLHRFDLVSSGTYTLSVTHPEEKSRQKLLQLSLGEGEIKEIAIVFGAVSRVLGTARVDDKTYSGLLTFSLRGAAMSDFIVKADDKGGFAVDLEPGDYMVTIPGKAVQQMISISPSQSQTIKVELK